MLVIVDIVRFYRKSIYAHNPFLLHGLSLPTNAPFNNSLKMMATSAGVTMYVCTTEIAHVVWDVKTLSFSKLDHI